MNERIKELAEQAVNSIPDQIDFDIPDVFKKKFAELIVQECADVGERYANGNYEVYNQILKRFEMEEE